MSTCYSSEEVMISLLVNHGWMPGESKTKESPGKIIQTMFPGPGLPGEKIGTELDLLTIPRPEL